MRRRQTELDSARLDLPERLRRFVCEEWADEPAEAHRRWRLARRAWEAEHGVTLAELWERQLQAARATRSLDAVNDLYAPGSFLDSEDPDPRLHV